MIQYLLQIYNSNLLQLVSIHFVNAIEWRKRIYIKFTLYVNGCLTLNNSGL